MIQLLSANVTVAVRANDAESFKGWLYEGLQLIGKPALIRLLEVMTPLLSTAEKDRIVSWRLGVSF